MDEPDELLIGALKAAPLDLQFRLIAPFSTTDRAGRRVTVEAFLPDFGGPNGMLIVSFARRLKLGAFDLPMSILPREGRKYVRKWTVDDLSDWGWFGEGDAPSWLAVRQP